MFDIKTGVIGAGSMGKNHVRILNEISNLVGIFDTNVDICNILLNSSLMLLDILLRKCQSNKKNFLKDIFS